MINYIDLRIPIELDDIIQLENECDISFPEEYKNHLLNYNGGSPEPNIFSFTENGKKTNSRINYFYAINSGEFDDLKEVIETFKITEKRMPTHILPIAEDPFGNVVCISAGKIDYGYIYFWDHENEVDYGIANDDDYSNLYFIAESFTEFINSLKSEVG